MFLGAVLNYQPKPENPTENNHSMTMMSGCGERGEYSATVSERTTMIKYQGLLKLFMRGRLRDPYHLSRILILWANVDYAGTALLQVTLQPQTTINSDNANNKGDKLTGFLYKSLSILCPNPGPGERPEGLQGVPLALGGR